MRIIRNPHLKVALTVEADSLRMLVVKGRRVQSWMTFSLPPNLAKDGAAPAPQSIEGVLSTLFFGREGLKHHLSVCLPGSDTLFRIVSLPKLKPQLVLEAIQREARQELPVETERLHLFWQRFFTSAERDDYLLVWVRKDSYEPLYAAFRQARVQPHLWELKPLALVRAVGLSEAVIVDLEPENTGLIVVAQGVPRIVRSLTNPSAMRREDWLRHLADEVSRCIALYQSSFPEDAGHRERRVVLTGQLASDSTIMQTLQAALPLPVEQFQCAYQAPQEFPAATYAAAVGLALKKGKPKANRLGQRGVDFNVLPSQQQHRVFPVKRVVAGAALVMGAVLLAPSFQATAHSEATLLEQRAELARLQRQVSLVKDSLVLRGELQKKIDQVNGQMRALQQERNSVLAGKGDVSLELRAAMTIAPPGVSISRLGTLGNTLVVGGETSTYAVLLEYTGALERSGFFQTVAIAEISQKTPGADPSMTTFVLSLDRRKAVEG